MRDVLGIGVAVLVMAACLSAPAALLEEYQNPVGDGTISIDASRLDWAGISSFSTDPDDAVASEVDWYRATVAHDSVNMYVRYELFDNSPALGWTYHMFIDSDRNRNTGYEGGIDADFGIGADYMLEGGSVFAYAGSGEDWTWGAPTAGSYDQTPTNDMEIAFARSLIGSPDSFYFILQGENATVKDVYPDSGASGPTGGYFGYNTIPEPASAALIGLGLLAGLRWRRRRM